ncbi:MAG TPA: multicopper oxidase family protein [Actinomycetota bacterium]|nr:multicopper oxidase family protein [Actinomycetota bacterium]
MTDRIDRRDFLYRAGTVAAAIASARLGFLSPDALAGGKRFVRRLPLPKVLSGPDIRLVARVADVKILPGAPTRMWTFNGTFPGPLIRRPSGRRTRVTVVNDLPAKAKSLTIHHHGSHSESKHDGLPLPEVAIEPGKSRTYVYEHMEDGKPERAALQWYHDHSHGRTSLNSWMGLAGLFILDDDFEKRLSLPKGRYEIPLFLTDRRFTANNQLDTELFETPAATREVRGDIYLVNGALRPFAEVEPRRYRFRVHNGSGFQMYNLVLRARSKQVPMIQIGTESGLLPAPVKRTEVLLGPAERADLVVDFSDFAGRNLTLKSKFLENATGSDGSRAGTFMQFRVRPKARRRDNSKIPKHLRPLPDWVSQAPAEPDRVWAFGNGIDPTTGEQAQTINGRAFDHERVDAQVELDSVETWLLVNTTTRSHFIHIHDVDWVILSRNDAAPPPYEAGLKETFRLDPGDSLAVAAKFSDHLGRFLIHCHMLDHEDGGMMATWEVVAPGAGTPTTLTDTERKRVDAVLAGRSPYVCKLDLG